MNVTEMIFLLTWCLRDYQPDRKKEKYIYTYFWVQKSCFLSCINKKQQYFLLQ